MGESVYFFIDNSNLWIQGERAVAELQELGEWGQQRCHKELSEMRIDYGALVDTLRNGRKLGQPPFIVGSTPPNNDSLWDSWRDQGMTIKVLARNCINKEKGVDTTLTAVAVETLCEKPVGTLILVAGDGDYSSILEMASKKRWPVEIYFWLKGKSDHDDDGEITYSTELHSQQSGACTTYTRMTEFTALDDKYTGFTFAYGPRKGGHKVQLEVSSGGDSVDITKWQNSDILKLLRPARVFVWINWVESTKFHIYFVKEEAASAAIAVLSENQDIVVELKT